MDGKLSSDQDQMVTLEANHLPIIVFDLTQTDSSNDEGARVLPFISHDNTIGHEYDGLSVEDITKNKRFFFIDEAVNRMVDLIFHDDRFLAKELVIVEAFGIRIYRTQFMSLMPGKPINGDIIDMFMELLKVRDARLTALTHTTTSLFGNYFTLCLLLGNQREDNVNYEFNRVHRSLKYNNIFNAKKIMLPFLMNKCWCLVMIIPSNYEIVFLLSHFKVFSVDDKEYLKDRVLHKWINDEAIFNEAEFDCAKWNVNYSSMNSFPMECGTSTLMFALLLTTNSVAEVSEHFKESTQENRKHIASSILNGYI